MARLFQTGAELNSTTALIDTTENSFTGSTHSVSSSTFRSGTYAGNINASATNAYEAFLFVSADTAAPFYGRAYINFASFPGTTCDIIGFTDLSINKKISLRCTSSGILQLWKEQATAAQIGSNSSAISLNTWYCLELKVDATTVGSTVCEGRIDGSSFASGTVAITVGIGRFYVGNKSVSSTYEFYWDDIGVNDSNGSFQNNFLGSGNIVHLLPNSAGDTNAWTRAGTDTGANYSQVNEITPDDITTYVKSTTLNQEDLYNLAASPSSIGSGDTINVVVVGVRFRSDNAASVPTFKLEIESSSGGTIEQSAGITPNSTTWTTNGIATPKNPALILYDLPGASTAAWTKADLDTAQIGYKITTDSTFNVNISTIWLSVDSTPNAGGGATQTVFPQRMRMGMGA